MRESGYGALHLLLYKAYSLYSKPQLNTMMTYNKGFRPPISMHSSDDLLWPQTIHNNNRDIRIGHHSTSKEENEGINSTNAI